MSFSSRKSRFGKCFSNPFAAQVVLETLEEVEEVDANASPAPNMLQPQRSSRLHRLSKFITPIKLDSKALQDPVTRKPAPAPLRESSPNRPPTRDAPVLYDINTHQPLQPPPTISSSKRLQKAESPSRLTFQPRTQSPARSLNTHGYSRSKDESLVPPPVLSDPAVGQGRSTSSPVNSRPTSYHSGSESDTGLTSKLRKRATWISGSGSRSRSRNPSHDSDGENSRSAWIKVGANTVDYSLTFLVNGEKVPELWTEDSDTFVYLFPRSSGCGPSFRVPFFILSSSKVLTSLIHGGDLYTGGPNRPRSFDGRGSLAAAGASRNIPNRGVGSPLSIYGVGTFDNQLSPDGLAEAMSALGDSPKETHIYFPTGIMSIGSDLNPEDVQRLVNIRNLFAFLTGQPLVATRQSPDTFRIFLAIASLLKQLQFTNLEGSTFGESAAQSFTSYLDEMKLSDVRDSREKTLEGIVLGESMRSVELYNESFAHAVGKYDAIRGLQSPIFNDLSPNTRNRLERSYMDLQQRLASVSLRLTTFEFPSLFAGIASSTSSTEAKYIHFKGWRSSFLTMRKFVLSYYKELHGQWPPKASSKKNVFIEGGLNRLVLKVLYNDFCQLYSLLVDRNSITTRSYDEADYEVPGGVDLTQGALRKLLSEYDRSSPPVQPPVPFDVPLVPTIATVNPSYPTLSVKDQNKQSVRKIKGNETMLLLTKSHNLDSDLNTPFIQKFKEFELHQSHHKNAQELADQRFGYWIFLYAVIQALPMVVIDAPGVRFTEAVDYFLCQPPIGNPPWMDDVPGVKAWYGIQGGQGGAVSMPIDVVNHGVEAVYRRSYCWAMANSWIGNESDSQSMLPPASEPEEMLSPLEPPPGLAGGEFGVRPQSRGRQPGTGWNNGLGPQDNSDQRSESRGKRRSIALGLEKLPIPVGYNSSSPNIAPVSADGYGASRDPSPAVHQRNPSSGAVFDQQFISASPVRTPVSGGPKGGRGSTFDDILGSMEQPQPPVKAKTKGKKK